MNFQKHFYQKNLHKIRDLQDKKGGCDRNVIILWECRKITKTSVMERDSFFFKKKIKVNFKF